MDWMALRIHDKGYNVINVRLPNHHQRTRTELDGFSCEDALSQNEDIARMAESLGDKVVYYGHSLGAALSIVSAIKHPEKTAGLVLLSPALKVYGGSQFLARILASMKLSGWLEDMLVGPTSDPLNRYISSYAALQVDNLTKQLARWNSQDGDEDYKYITERLNKVPIFWAETALDIVIDLKTNQRIAGSLENTQFSVLPWQLGLSHDKIVVEPAKANRRAQPKLEELADQILTFIQSLAK
jgi:pimeloyl-ACP methyl ester carboxylesterase